MNKKNVKILLIICVLLLGLGIGLSLKSNFGDEKKKKEEIEDFKNKSIEEIQTEAITKSEVNEITTRLLEDDITEGELAKFVGYPVENYYIYYGKDSYIRTLGSDVVGLEAYDDKRDMYASELESYIKDNFDVKLKEYIVSADGAIVQRFSYKTYYYIFFLDDMFAVKDKLIEYSGIDINVNANLTKEEKEKIYMLEVKALELMSDYFDDYVNTDEVINYDLIYKKGEDKIYNDYYSLLLNLAGNTYNNERFADESLREVRVNKIVNSAISSGKLDINNPYKLN